ncbi:MAG: RNA-binding S4 domain-containing protein [Clostridia bacterium]|nr:RNA-binding S4 domain-containing protein [Clostridia bacterium]
MEIRKISIKEEFIRLDSALKLAGLVSTGGHAKIVIQGGEVRVNDTVCTMRGKKLHSGDTVSFEGQEFVIE